MLTAFECRCFDTNYYLIRLDKALYRPRVIAPFGANRGKRRLVYLARHNPLAVAINAGLFNPLPHTYEPEGIIIENGVVIQNKPAVFYPDSMPLTIDRNGKLWYADANADADELVKQSIVHAVCGFMPILIDGKAVPPEQWTKVPHYNNPHQRQIIGQFSNGDYGILTCEGRGYADSVGWTIADAQRVCLEHGFDFAYNLDGGTSTETVVNGELINSKYERASDRFASTFIVFTQV